MELGWRRASRLQGAKKTHGGTGYHQDFSLRGRVRVDKFFLFNPEAVLWIVSLGGVRVLGGWGSGAEAPESKVGHSGMGGFENRGP